MEEKDKELLAEIGGLLQESASSVLSMLLPKATEVTVEEMGEWTPTAYPESMVLVTATFTEGPSGSVYFVMTAKLVSVLVDLMLGGEGSAEREINEESKDALKEVVNQILGATASGLRERYEGPATFSQVEVHALEPNIDLNLLLGDDTLFRVPLALKFEGKEAGSYGICLPAETLTSLRQDLIEADAEALAQAAAKKSDEDPVAAAMAETAAEAKKQAPKQEAAAESAHHAAPSNVGIILDIELPIVIRLGSAEMTLQEIVRLGPGSIIELNKSVDEPVELLINNKMIARGEVVVVEGNFAFRVTDIESKTARIQSLG